MLTSILGYRLWASLVDRFGSIPVLRIRILPATFLPVLWVCNAPGAYTMIPPGPHQRHPRLERDRRRRGAGELLFWYLGEHLDDPVASPYPR